MCKLFFVAVNVTVVTVIVLSAGLFFNLRLPS